MFILPNFLNFSHKIWSWIFCKYLSHILQILESSFCKNCEEPKAIFNGKVEIINNIAYYSCFAGYELNMKKYIKGRRCTKAAKWEGYYEPYCKSKYLKIHVHIWRVQSFLLVYNRIHIAFNSRWECKCPLTYSNVHISLLLTQFFLPTNPLRMSGLLAICFV